jgi:hypothetical protein
LGMKMNDIPQIILDFSSRYKIATVGVNQRNDGEQVINSWLHRNSMEKMRMFP